MLRSVNRCQAEGGQRCWEPKQTTAAAECACGMGAEGSWRESEPAAHDACPVARFRLVDTTMEQAGSSGSQFDGSAFLFGRVASALRSVTQASWDKFLQTEGARCDRCRPTRHSPALTCAFDALAPPSRPAPARCTPSWSGRTPPGCCCTWRAEIWWRCARPPAAAAGCDAAPGGGCPQCCAACG